VASYLSQLPKPGSVHAGAGADPDGYGDQLRMVLANYENPEKGSDRSPRIVITATTVHGEAIVVASSVGGRMHPLFSHTACQSSPR
jgi:hypothetical protein